MLRTLNGKKVGSMKEGQLKESSGNSKKNPKMNARDEKIL